MGKNLTIYLPNEVAEKMENFPEVNWSEICRKAVADYIETRSETDLAPILEKLKKERSEDFKQGQLVMYSQIIPKMALKDFEFLHSRIDKTLIKETPAIMQLPGEKPLSQVSAEHIAINQMSMWLKRFGKECGANVPEFFTHAYAEGAIDAFLDVFTRIKPSK